MDARQIPAAMSPSPRLERTRVSLLARQIFAITLLALFVLAVATVVYVGRLGTLIWQDTLSEATLTARQVYARCSLTLTRRPTGDPLGVLRTDPDLRHQVEASVGYSSNVLYVMISDADNRAVMHSDPKQEGKVLPAKPDLADGEAPELAAVREAEEETGLVVALVPGAAPFVAVDPLGGKLVHTFLATVTGGGAGLRGEVPGEGTPCWATPAELVAGPYGDYNRRAFDFFGIAY